MAGCDAENSRQQSERTVSIDPVPIFFSPETVVEIPVSSSPVKIELDDIQPEIDFWASSIYCYVVGNNPPRSVMEGFIRRVWRNMGVDKVIVVKKGMFMIRFKTMEKRDQAVKDHLFFDSRPVIIKPWHPDIDMLKEDVNTLPTWVHLHLDFKYRGEGCLNKIAGQVV